MDTPCTFLDIGYWNVQKGIAITTFLNCSIHNAYLQIISYLWLDLKLNLNSKLIDVKRNKSKKSLASLWKLKYYLSNMVFSQINSFRNKKRCTTTYVTSILQHKNHACSTSSTFENFVVASPFYNVLECMIASKYGKISRCSHLKHKLTFFSYSKGYNLIVE